MICALGSCRFGLAESAEIRQEIYDLRASHYIYEAPYLLAENLSGKDRYDDISMVFYLQADDRIIATSRLTPFHDNHWEITGQLPGRLLQFNSETHAQFNRILVDRDYRNRSVHELMFYLACEWVIANTRITYYFSVCTIPHFRFYAAYGAMRISEKVLLQGRGSTNYVLVEGSLEDARRLTRAQLHKNGNLPEAIPAFDTKPLGES